MIPHSVNLNIDIKDLAEKAKKILSTHNGKSL